MPELPEVRTVAKILKEKLLNQKLTDYKVIYPKTITPNSLNLDLLINQNLKDIRTYGKYLVFDFNEYFLVSHLRMEGKYFVKPASEKIVKHEHVIFYFGDMSLRYHDTRKFGRMQLIKPGDLDQVEGLSKLAPEPFDPKMTKEFLSEKLKKKSLPIKSSLLDQTIISGLGNIYVDEVLYASKINPLKASKDLTLEECEKIITNAIKILNEAIKHGGTTIFSYQAVGVEGHYQGKLKVHTKVGQECPLCHAIIKKIKVGGRGTYYCPSCQN